MSDVHVLRAGDEVDRANVAAVLAKYLPLGESQAEGWAEIVCEQRAEPLPGEALTVVLERDAQGEAVRRGAPSGEGYTLREVQAAAKRYAAELTTGDRPACGSLLAALKRGRKLWVREREKQMQALGRRALPAETDGTQEDREARERAAAKTAVAKILADLTGSLSMGGKQ